MPVIVLQASKQAVPDAQTNGWKKPLSDPQPQSPSSPSKPARPTTTPEQTPSPKAGAYAQPEQQMTSPAPKHSTTPASAQKRLPSSPDSEQKKASSSLERAEQKSVSDAAHAGPVVHSPAAAEDKSPSPSKPATAAADQGQSVVCLNCLKRYSAIYSSETSCIWLHLLLNAPKSGTSVFCCHDYCP